jgi:hypothetical protein
MREFNSAWLKRLAEIDFEKLLIAKKSLDSSQKIRRLEAIRRARTKAQSSATERAFHDAVLQGGPMPIAMVRARLENVPLTRDGPASWRFADALPPPIPASQE